MFFEKFYTNPKDKMDWKKTQIILPFVCSNLFSIFFSSLDKWQNQILEEINKVAINITKMGKVWNI